MLMGREGQLSALERLEAISRTRPLTDLETRQLVVEMNRATRRKDRVLKGQKHWSAADVLRLRAHLLRGKKPAQIAVVMNRTERAVWRMMNLLGWSVRDAQVWVINPHEALSAARANRRRVQSQPDE